MTRLRLAFAVLSLSLGACAAQSYKPVTPDAGVKIGAPMPKEIVVERGALRAKLAERRAATIAHFIAYRDARTYPINELPGGGFRHVWIDPAGNLCAAATLISKDWGRDATIAVGRENLELKIADVTKGPVLDWILTSGLTRAELVAIQVPGFEWQGDMQRDNEINRLFALYQDVERQIRSLDKANLELAVDELMKNPALAKQLLSGKLAGPGKFAKPPVG